MDLTLRGFDPTLPLEFNGSLDMNNLPNVSQDGGHPPVGSQSQTSDSVSFSSSVSSLYRPVVPRTGSGRLSPMTRGRTMKEYEELISDLRKENFSLKLRIYYLEERVQQKYGDGEDVHKTNVELKVAVDSLRQELADKQELLCKASQAMETLTSQQQSEMEEIRKSMEEEHEKHTSALRSDLQKALQDAEDCRQEADKAREKMIDLEVRVQQLEAEHQQASVANQKLKEAVQMKEREVGELQDEIKAAARQLEDARHLQCEAESQREAAEQRAQQVEKDLERRGRDVEQLSVALKDTSMIDGQSFLAPTHLQDVVDDQQEKLKRLEGEVARMKESLNEKNDMIGHLEDGLRDKDKQQKEAENKAQQLQNELDQEKEYARRYNLTIQGLVSQAHKREKELKLAKEKYDKAKQMVKTLREDLHKAEMEKHQEVEKLQEELAESEDRNRSLQTQLSVAMADTENMIKSLGKKEGELAGFREQLEKANNALKASEDALEALQKQLEKEREESNAKLDSKAKQHQNMQQMLEDHMQQLESKNALIAQMTEQLRAKNEHLTSLMDLLNDNSNKGQKAVLQRLEDGLNRSDASVQNTLEEKQQELEKKNRELHEARQALQDKSQELEQANLQLVETKEELEKLQMKNKEESDAIAQLSAELSRTQNVLEATRLRHAAELQRKDGIIERLQKWLTEKGQMLDELREKTPAADKECQQLRAQLREKENQIEELHTEQVRASCERDKLARTMQASLQERDSEIDNLTKKQQKELANRDQEIQSLMSQLSKKDMQLKGLESRMAIAEQQQQETLDQLRRMMAEKDKTIAGLMETLEKKEELLRMLQPNLTEDAKAQMHKLNSLIEENQELRHTLTRLEGMAEQGANRETYHSSHHETVTHNVGDNSQVVRLLQEQVFETRALCRMLRQERPSDANASRTAGARDRASRDSQRSSRHALSAVEKLCERLESNINRSQSLHQSLLGHTARNNDHFTSSESSVSRFGDSQDRSAFDNSPSASLACSGASAQRNTNRHATSTQISHPQSTLSSAVQTSPCLFGETSGGAQTLSEGGVGLEGRTQGSQTSVAESEGSQDGTGYADSHASLSRASLTSLGSLSSTRLAGMSAAVLRDLVSQLQEDLVAMTQRNASLNLQLKSLSLNRDVEDWMLESASEETEASGQKELELAGMAQLRAEVKKLKQALQSKEEEEASLRRELGLPHASRSSGVDAPHPTPHSLSVAELHNQIQELRQQVSEMSRANSLLKQQIRLNTQTEDAPQGFNPQLIVDMAAEIERLKLENACFRSHADEHCLEHSARIPGERSSAETLTSHAGDGAAVVNGHLKNKKHQLDAQPSASLPDQRQLSLSSPPPLDDSQNRGRSDRSLSRVPHKTMSTSSVESDWTPRMLGNGECRVGSPVPRLAKLRLNGTDLNSQPMVNMTRRLQDAQEQIKTLEERLHATEGTVRYMSQRLRHFRALAGKQKEQGLSRSVSDACLLNHQTLSLSYSCGDLREASQAATHAPGQPEFLGFNSSDLSAVCEDRKDGDLGAARSMINNLKEQIRQLKEKHTKELENKENQLSRLRLSRLPPTGQEEDGGSSQVTRNRKSTQSSGMSQEIMRDRPATSSLSIQGQDLGWDAVDSRKHVHPYHNDTSMNASRLSSSALSGGTEQTVDPSQRSSPSQSHQASSVPSLPLPANGTLSTTMDHPDMTQMENITYSSFSESILLGQGQRDSAWSSPQLQQQNRGSSPARRSNTDPHGLSPLVRSEGVGGHEQFSVGVGDDGSPNQTSNKTRVSSGDYDVSTMCEASTMCDQDQSVFEIENSRLQAKVAVLTDMNRTMQEEIRVYDHMCRSLGVQVTPGAAPAESFREDSCDNETRILQLHLTELRQLRSRLERIDTDAHNAAQVSSLLSQQHLQRIAELESLIAQLRGQLDQQEALASERQSIIIQHECVITETNKTVERWQDEARQLKEKVSALEESDSDRVKQQEGEIEGLRQQLQELQEQFEESQEKLTDSHNQSQELNVQLRQARQRAKTLESDLAQSRQTVQSLELRIYQSSHTQKDLEFRLSEVGQQRDTLQEKLAASQEKLESLEVALAGDKEQASSLSTELTGAKKRLCSLEQALTREKEHSSSLSADLREAKRRAQSLQEELEEAQEKATELEKKASQLESELSTTKTKVTLAEEQIERAHRTAGALSADKRTMQKTQERLEKELEDLRHECTSAKKKAAVVAVKEEECQQLAQRVEHFQERMKHYEELMRESQQQALESESRVKELQNLLRTTQAGEEDTKSELRVRDNQIQELEVELREALDRAKANEDIAVHANSLVRSLESRVRDSEGRVNAADGKLSVAEDLVQKAEEKVRELQASLTEQTNRAESLRREISERNAKFKKRELQMKKLIDEYKKTRASEEEKSQLNDTLKSELKLYETMHSQTGLSRDKKEELMRELLSELTRTRRLAEDLITKLERMRQNDSPASTATGSEAADGRPSPEPRDGTQPVTSLQIHTQSYRAALASLRSPLINSDTEGPDPRTERARSESPALESPSSLSSQSDGGHGARPKTRLDAQNEPIISFPSSPAVSGDQSVPRGAGVSRSMEQREHILKEFEQGSMGEAARPSGSDSEDSTGLHTRSFTYPVSLKYWQEKRTSLPFLIALPHRQTDSDLRRLFAISELEGFEKLKRETQELLTILASMQARMSDRLKSFVNVPMTESLEYSTLRELQMEGENLKICMMEQQRLLEAFWFTQLPPTNAYGEFYDPKLAEENQKLWLALRKQKTRYDMLVHTVREQQERLHATNELRKKWEGTLYKQLSATADSLERAKENFDAQGLIPPRKKSPRKKDGPPRQFKDVN